MEFEITLRWRYTPDPLDYNDGDPWTPIEPSEALAIDLSNISRDPVAYLPSDADRIEVDGRVIP